VFLSAEDPMFATWRTPHTRSVRRVDVFPTRASNVGLNFADGSFRRDRTVLGSVASLRLPGLFQRENTLYSLGIAHALGAAPERLARAIEHVRGLPHRLEDLGIRAGHRVWDNAVSTTPDSTLAVLPSLAPGFTLVCGGKPKALALEPLLDAALGCVRRVVVFGSAVDAFAPAFRARGFETWSAPTVEGAVALAFEHMSDGEELLFSPACASFDAYLNFKERALAFRSALPSLEPNPVGPTARA
jgi:UDP-N-acetylmuramoylalanine--D-glutamate ligase